MVSRRLDSVRLFAGARASGDSAGGVGFVAGKQGHQHGVRGETQRYGSEPKRAESAEDLLFFQGLGCTPSGHLFHDVQLQLLLAGADVASA